MAIVIEEISNIGVQGKKAQGKKSNQTSALWIRDDLPKEQGKLSGEKRLKLIKL
jgi:hypothetical protein